MPSVVTVLLLFLPLLSFSQAAPSPDSAAPPAADAAADTLREPADSVSAGAFDTSRAAEEEDEEELNEDSLAALRTAYDLTGLSQHIGANGLTLFLSFVQQFRGENTTLPTAHSFGAGFSGDVLTGLSFVHLIPSFHYWQYSEKGGMGFVEGQTYRDVGVSFHSALMSPRVTGRKARAFFGAGPSLHLTLLTQEISLQDSTAHFTTTASNFKNGFSLLLGAELPLTGTFAFLVTAAYKQTYDWSRLDRQYLMISLGLAM